MHLHLLPNVKEQDKALCDDWVEVNREWKAKQELQINIFLS